MKTQRNQVYIYPAQNKLSVKNNSRKQSKLLFNDLKDKFNNNL